MKTVKVIFKQIVNWLNGDSYPCMETWGYWEYHFVNYKCKYKHLKTLYNYLRKRKTLRKQI